MVGTSIARKHRFFIGADCTNDARADMFEPLHQQQANPACRRMHQYIPFRLNLGAAFDQKFGRAAF